MNARVVSSGATRISAGLRRRCRWPGLWPPGSAGVDLAVDRGSRPHEERAVRQQHRQERAQRAPPARVAPAPTEPATAPPMRAPRPPRTAPASAWPSLNRNDDGRPAEGHRPDDQQHGGGANGSPVPRVPLSVSAAATPSSSATAGARAPGRCCAQSPPPTARTGRNEGRDRKAAGALPVLRQGPLPPRLPDRGRTGASKGKIQGQLDEVLARSVAMAGGILQVLRCIDVRETAHQLFQKKILSRKGRPVRHGPSTPTENERRLQQQADVQLPAQQFAPASLPGHQGRESQGGTSTPRRSCSRNLPPGRGACRCSRAAARRYRGVETGVQPASAPPPPPPARVVASQMAAW